MKRAVYAAIGLVAVMTVATLNARCEQRRQAARPFWNDLKAGPHAVGFRVLYHRDHRRLWLNKTVGTDANPGRPIRVSQTYRFLKFVVGR